MSNEIYPEEFKIEAVGQLVDKIHPVAKVASTIGRESAQSVQVDQGAAPPAGQCQEQLSQIEELRLLKAELKRVTEERDILKKAAAYFAKLSG